MADPTQHPLPLVNRAVPDYGTLLHGHTHHLNNYQPTQDDLDLFAKHLSLAVNACDTVAARKISETCAQEDNK